MNEHQDNQNEPKLSDDQMDGLLSSFFDQEVPDKLNRLPSQWAEVTDTQTVPSLQVTSQSNWSQRIIAGGASLLAASLLLFVISNPFGSTTEDNGDQTVEVKDQKTESVIDEDATVNVSSNNDEQVIDDVNTTLEEIGVIDLSPLTTGEETLLEDRQ